MEPLVLLSLFSLVGLAFWDFGGKDDEDEPEGETFLVEPGSELEGTEKADIFTISDARFGDAPVSIDAGAGDDTLTLWREDEHSNGDVLSSDSVVDGDDGNDTINVSGSPDVEGGDGNDIIVADVHGSHIYGDSGNDTIIISSGGEAPSAYGGEGDDFLDGREIRNGDLYGGDGDDTIVITNGNRGGTGYVINVQGGSGADTIRLDGHSFDEAYEPINALGGTGADTFELNLQQTGLDQHTELYPYNLIRLGDFELGEDQVVIDITSQLTASYPDALTYTLSSGEIVEDKAAGTTELIFSYEAAGADDLAYTVIINAVGVTWADISFADGTEPPLLVPLA